MTRRALSLLVGGALALTLLLIGAVFGLIDLVADEIGRLFTGV